MKKMMKNSVLVAVALFLVFSVVFSATASANEGKKDNPVIELKHIGTYDNQPIFQLSLNTPVEEEFTITLRDKDGNVLYSDKVKGTSITKKFLLSTEEVGDNILSVEVKAKKNTKAEIYTINRKQNLVEETLVTKLK